MAELKARDEATLNKINRLIEQLDQTGWYHSIELPDGRVIEGLIPIETLKKRLAHFPLPADLSGKRVLDIGAWDGWFSFEMERRGAQVMAVDCFENERMLEAMRLAGSRIDYRVMDMYELTPERIGRFDIVLFLGVLYHLKHPLLALERVCDLATELACVESFVLDDGLVKQTPMMEFYEADELMGRFDNWVGPNSDCVLSMCRAAGFARVVNCGVVEQRVHAACYRKWEAPPAAPSQSAPELVKCVNAADYGINFSTRRDDYISLWFDSSEGGLTRDNVMPEIGGYGVIPVHVGASEGARWCATAKLPPGLAPGWHSARVRTASSAFSGEVSIALDVPLDDAQCPEIRGRAGNVNWRQGELELGCDTHLCVWVAGLPANADVANVRLVIGGRRLKPEYCGPSQFAGEHQVNARVPAGMAPGQYELNVVCGSARSQPASLLLK